MFGEQPRLNQEVACFAYRRPADTHLLRDDRVWYFLSRSEAPVHDALRSSGRYATGMAIARALDEPLPDLVGRAREVHYLSGLIDATRPTGASLIIEGDAGIGKTSLLEFATRSALQQNFRLLQTAGLQNGIPAGYAALHELLHPILALVDTLPPRQRSALLTAFGLDDGPIPERLLVCLAALGLIEEAASRKPIFLSIEDLQWVDTSSAFAINFIGLRLTGVPVLLIATARTGPDEDELLPFALTRLPVEPLNVQSAEALLLQVAADLAPLARLKILDAARGNPLALRELPIALREHGIARTALHERLPTTKRLERTFLDQLAHVPARSRWLLLLAAAADGANVTDILAAARTAGVGIDDLAPLENTGLVEISGGTFRFRHPLVRSAVQGSATTAEWTRAHRALASAVSDRGVAAWHRAASTLERDEAIASELEETAIRAAQRGAQPEAARALQRAATLSETIEERVRRLAAAAERWRAAGMGLQASEILDEIAPIAKDPETVADMVVSRVNLSLTVGSSSISSTEMAAISASLSHRSEDTDHRVKVLWGAAIHARGRGLPTAEWQMIEAELESIATTNPLKSVALALLASPEKVNTLRAQLPDLVPQLMDYPQGLVVLGVASESLQDLETALTCWGLAASRFHERGEAADQAAAIRGRSNVLLLRGRLREGLADAEYAQRMAYDTGQPQIESMAAATVARAHALLGNIDAASEALRGHSALAGRGPLAPMSADARWAAGLVALAEHRYRDAFIELTHMSVHPTRSLWAIADRTEAAVRAGRAESVAGNVLHAAAAAKSYRSTYLASLVARSNALLANGKDAAAEFEKAIEAGQLSESPLELARSKLLYGEWLRRERKVADARVLIGEALREFDSAGAQGFAERAASELRAAGETPHRDLRSSPLVETLTPQELQVARLAAEGMSNKEIADRIYLSHRTVSTHLYRVYPKLHITARSQLSAALAKLDVVQ